ncbi:hypothetical protein DAPPUDRAFT_238642 [Daphnia pulex]|uniref:Uncharacterized protein n=1 Tax=Daphnia pulex TaxID=6669 RepID=E9G700_DAPPU|nr:hypothetical protein DAPPUDRAFT_238657 [Daphnia pulex]EFX84722.1 hypothetical protein DAPPUDRAFT_238644 [Daphnia pulex]EFX84724.1 hypothetical protein DAPPUDRAFT_238642 [Daphnia pulex]|eukprot:EFX84718.1 hypothetical protein DAPPUDRAFT_238657 [Daphnia pulex]
MTTTLVDGLEMKGLYKGTTKRLHFVFGLIYSSLNPQIAEMKADESLIGPAPDGAPEPKLRTETSTRTIQTRSVPPEWEEIAFFPHN